MNHVNIKIASEGFSNVNCCLCRQDLNKKGLNLYFNLKSISYLNGIYKLIESFTIDYEFVFFSKNFDAGYEYILNELINHAFNKQLQIFDNQNCLINKKLNKSNHTVIFMLENQENYTAYQIFKNYNFKNCFMIG